MEKVDGWVQQSRRFSKQIQQSERGARNWRGFSRKNIKGRSNGMRVIMKQSDNKKNGG